MRKFVNTYTILYLLVGVLGTLVTVWFKPLQVAGLAIPPSSWLMGFSFLLITLIQDKYGNSVSSKMIWILLTITAGICLLLNYTMMLVIASGVAFVVGQFCTKGLYTYGVNRSASGIIGSIVDATIWIVLGLSPIGVGTVSWSVIPSAVVGQVIVQVILQYIAGQIYAKYLE